MKTALVEGETVVQKKIFKKKPPTVLEWKSGKELLSLSQGATELQTSQFFGSIHIF